MRLSWVFWQIVFRQILKCWQSPSIGDIASNKTRSHSFCKVSSALCHITFFYCLSDSEISISRAHNLGLNNIERVTDKPGEYTSYSSDDWSFCDIFSTPVFASALCLIDSPPCFQELVEPEIGRPAGHCPHNRGNKSFIQRHEAFISEKGGNLPSISNFLAVYLSSSLDQIKWIVEHIRDSVTKARLDFSKQSI